MDKVDGKKSTAIFCANKIFSGLDRVSQIFFLHHRFLNSFFKTGSAEIFFANPGPTERFILFYVSLMLSLPSTFIFR